MKFRRTVFLSILTVMSFSLTSIRIYFRLALYILRTFFMPTTYPTRVKICCISSKEEADLAIRYGASALGLVSEMPSGPGVISNEQIVEIAAQIPPGITKVLLTSKQTSAAIISQVKMWPINAIQIVDKLIDEGYDVIRTALPAVSIIQVIHVTGENAITEAEAVEPFVDAVLLDSGNPDLHLKELGGTGRTHNWQTSHEIVRRLDIPVFLAGGLNAENIQKAVTAVHPFAVDVCSGVRTNDRLDEDKLSRFMQQVNHS